MQCATCSVDMLAHDLCSYKTVAFVFDAEKGQRYDFPHQVCRYCTQTLHSMELKWSNTVMLVTQSNSTKSVGFNIVSVSPYFQFHDMLPCDAFVTMLYRRTEQNDYTVSIWPALFFW